MRELIKAFESAQEFVPAEHGFRDETATFDAVVGVGADGVDVTVEVPTLSAAVVGDDVAAVIEDGWFETFERRVRDVSGVIPRAVETPTLARHTETIAVETHISTRGSGAPADALAIINFIEGTWFGGIIPGYEYIEPVQEARQQAAEAGGSDDPTPL